MRDELNESEGSTFADSRQIDELQSAIDETSEGDLACRREGKWDDNLDDLQFWELLGSGAYGDVFKAFNHKEDKSCAVKVLRIPKKMVEYQKREIRALGMLYHPNIVEMHCASIVKKSILIMVMPLLWSLEDIIEEVRLSKHHDEIDCISEDTCRQLILQLLEGLSFMHSKGIAHRDLKAANLLLDGHGVLKIADFGVCHEFDITAGSQTGQLYSLCGSEVYMAPEVYLKLFESEGREEEAYDIRSESWSVGIIFFELRLGQVPFWSILKEPNRHSRLKHALKRFLKSHYFDFDLLYPLGERHERKCFSDPAITFLRQCLHTKPHERPTAKDLLATDVWINQPDRVGINRIRRELMKNEYLEQVEIVDRFGNMDLMAEYDKVGPRLPPHGAIITIMVKGPNTNYTVRNIRFVVEIRRDSFSTRAAEKLVRGKILPFSRKKIIGGGDYIRLSLKVVEACRRFAHTDNVKLVYEMFSLSNLPRPPNPNNLDGMALVLINRSLRTSQRILHSPVPGVDVRAGELHRREYRNLREEALKAIGIDRDEAPSQTSSETLLSSVKSPANSDVLSTTLAVPEQRDIEDGGTIQKRNIFKSLFPITPFGFNRVLRFNHSDDPQKK